MSAYQNLPAVPGTKPAKRPLWKRPALRYTAVAVLGLTLGAATSAGGSEPEVVTKTVEVEVPGPTETITETAYVDVEVTPPACLDALDIAGQAMSIMAESAGLAGDGIEAAAYGDVAGLDRVTAQVGDLNEDLNTLNPDLSAAVDECRAGAR